MKTQHTPGPWSIKGAEIFDGLNETPIAKAFHVFYRKGDQPIISDTANAAFIVKAVNCHHDLLEALIFIVNDVPKPGADAQLTVTGYNRACAAIAKATGGQV